MEQETDLDFERGNVITSESVFFLLITSNRMCIEIRKCHFP